ncbi:hypothetical protein [Sandaracinus amylolyticus]|uniref:hypothetical protein n=1 Tax=Sandaracinus amylolyticus TaxID=927083 RepID=UPI001F419477|nr:hypothetical protein [Sandaracinus amylolyticus]UJR85706.1 Hypothetical protein I5071_77860 [Sandaracinus amylolyticus]
MDRASSRSGWAALAAWLLFALPAHAQETPAPMSPGEELAETMRTGIVPLFTAMGAGMLFMAVLVVLAVMMLRPRLPTNLSGA